MCDHGNQVILNVPIPGHLSHTGLDRWDDKPIDSCIAPIVKALNDAGIYTVACCCGHGKGGGSIILWDGRELVLRPTDIFQHMEKVVAVAREFDDEMTETSRRWGIRRALEELDAALTHV